MTMTTQEDRSFAPPHIPEDRIWPHDLNAFAMTLDDPYRMHSVLREGPELIYVKGATRGQPGWVPTRSDLIREIFMDSERFSSVGNVGVDQILGVDWRLGAIDYDPPEHMKHRLILQPLFQPNAINRYETLIRRIAIDLIEAFADKGGCDFMSEFTVSFPSHIFLELADLPKENLERFFGWEHAFVRGASPEIRKEGLINIVNYIESVVESRRGVQGTDIYSIIVNGEFRGAPLEHGDIMGALLVMYLGGLDTVISSLGWHMRHIATDPALQTRLRENPKDIDGAVDDLFRAYGVTTTRRFVREDMDYRGVPMKKGDRILLPTYLASRDPDIWDDPDRVDPDRKPRHLTFSTGIHNCIGAHLARREVKVVLEEILGRFDNIRLDPERPPQWQTAGVWSMTTLPLLWD